MTRPHHDEAGHVGFVSTGSLPPADVVASLVVETFERYRTDDDGATSDVYPALRRVPAQLFGLCIVDTAGVDYAAGDADVEFSIMSVAKPFVFALVCDAIGAETATRLVGANATGLPFNSLAAVEHRSDGRTNPMVNPGAIATTSLVPGATSGGRWRFIADGLGRFAGRELGIDEEMYASASATNHRNREIARRLEFRGLLHSDAATTVDLYTRQSCMRVTARDLGVMGATLADGGVNPHSAERVVDADSCRAVLVAMATAGLYETSGEWLFEVGLPGKSGIGGGIVTVSPGKCGLGMFAPLLDGAGNSVKGQRAARFISNRLGLDLFASQPAG
jgi:glutaminase